MSIISRAAAAAAAASAAVVAIAGFATSARAAGVFTYAPFTGDADSGVSSLNTYSHAIDFAAPAGAVLVNGVRFNDDDDQTTGQPSYALIGVPSGHGGTPNPNNLTGEIAKVVQAFRYGATDSGQATFTLKGLRPGATYLTTFFTRGWDTPPRNINLTTSDGGSISFNEDGFGQGNGGKLTYAFTATANALTFNFVPAAADSFHFYGMANQIVAGSPFTKRAVTGDADSGVVPGGAYTHAVDLNGAGGAVNGVNFIGGGTSGDGGFGKTYTIAGTTDAFSGDSTNVTGSLGSMLTNFIYGHDAGGTSGLTLDGLIPGETYEFTLFASSFGGAGGRFVTISHNSGSIVYDANFTGDDNGNALSYVYTATGTSETFNFDPHDPADTLHIYAFANRAVPEPASLSLLALAGVALRRGRRRMA